MLFPETSLEHRTGTKTTDSNNGVFLKNCFFFYEMWEIVGILCSAELHKYMKVPKQAFAIFVIRLFLAVLHLTQKWRQDPLL
jgi:hypothetical protein